MLNQYELEFLVDKDSNEYTIRQESCAFIITIVLTRKIEIWALSYRSVFHLDGSYIVQHLQ